MNAKEAKERTWHLEAMREDPAYAIIMEAIEEACMSGNYSVMINVKDYGWLTNYKACTLSTMRLLTTLGYQIGIRLNKDSLDKNEYSIPIDHFSGDVEDIFYYRIMW